MGKGKRKGGRAGTGANGGGTSKKVKKNDVVELIEQVDDSGNKTKNPFLVHLVVKTIMSHMTTEDLKISRGVCHLWDQMSTLELKKMSCQMKANMFRKSDQLQKFVTTLENSPNRIFLSHSIWITLQAISKQKRRFFQNFEPKSVCLEAEEGDAKVTLQLITILQNCSKSIKEFQLVGELSHGQFGGKIKWPKKLNFPQLEELLLDMSYGLEELDDVKFIIENVTKNSPKFKSFKLVNWPVDHGLCDLFKKSPGLIKNLQNLELYYGYCSGEGDWVFAQDLLDMAEAGLKLTKLTIDVTFEEILDNDSILGHMDKLRKFLMSQSETLIELVISINFESHFMALGFSMPPLPKLKVLEIANENSWKVSYTPIDLPIILPNLCEIIIDLKSDLCNPSKLFVGSLEGVKKVRVKHPVGNSFKNYKNYRQLATHFPRVVEFEVDHMERIEWWNNQYREIPWETTLKKLRIHPPTIELFDFDVLSHLKGLDRIEMIRRESNKDFDEDPDVDFDLEGLSKTSVKSLKIEDYQFDEKVLEEIRSGYILDYIPSKLTTKRLTDEEFEAELEDVDNSDLLVCCLQNI